MESSNTKLALGTVQFGLKYGINNQSEVLTETGVRSILDEAFSNGIDLLDTAPAYGNSEEVLGRNAIGNFNVVTKLPAETKTGQVKSALEKSLNDLSISTVYGYILHDYSDLKRNPTLWKELKELKVEGLVKKIGISIYHPEELQHFLSLGFCPDLVQFPMNIADRRFVKWLPILKEMGTEIHIRSAFLQGLLLMEKEKRPSFFKPVNKQLNRVSSVCYELNISAEVLCLSFLYHNNNIDRIIIGVDSINQLKKNSLSFKHAHQIKIPDELLNELIIDDNKFILPYNWEL
jgi:aryl-alcohol dehydrogenase-like predicted oxidoreductase